MSAKRVLSDVTSEIAECLKPVGFRRAGPRFHRPGPEVTTLIELQTARGARPEQLSIAVNYGVVIKSLIEALTPKTLTYTDCHWGRRAAGTHGVECWWTVRESDSPKSVALELKDVLDRQVLPAVDAKQTEDDLIALWRTGSCPSLVEEQRLLYLGLLLWRAGRRTEFFEVQAQLEARPRSAFQFRALEQLRNLSDAI